MTTVFCRRHEGALFPADAKAAETISRIPRSELVKVEVTRPRNLGWHRKFFALLQLLHENQSEIEDFDDFRAVFLVALGHCEMFGAVAVPKSVSFAKLDQAGFESLWERAVKVACTKIIPHLDRADLEREVKELVGL